MKGNKILKIAVIGAGLSGLALAWHLIESGCCCVTLFDPKGIGGEASGIAAGLLHPYPGEAAKRSFLATEGLAATRKLLKVAQFKSTSPLANEKGIIRYPQNSEMRSVLLSHAQEYEDIKPYGQDGFLILSGMTIFSKSYLEALWLAAQERGVKLEKKKIETFDALSSYDHIVLAAGAGVMAFAETQLLCLELLKGQVLKCKIPKEVLFPEQSIIGKGYIAHAAEENMCYVGSTYERGQLNAVPDPGKATKELMAKAMLFYPQTSSLSVVDCYAAFRVARIGHYYPIAARLKKNIWIITALGSRGLLYHGILAEKMKEAILSDEDAVLPKEFKIDLLRN